MKQFTLKIDGMSCAHCQKALETALGQLEGVQSVSVDLESSEAVVEADDHLLDEIKTAVRDAGYSTN